jgi:hypothetical protein
MERAPFFLFPALLMAAAILTAGCGAKVPTAGDADGLLFDSSRRLIYRPPGSAP